MIIGEQAAGSDAPGQQPRRLWGDDDLGRGFVLGKVPAETRSILPAAMLFHYHLGRDIVNLLGIFEAQIRTGSIAMRAVFALILNLMNHLFPGMDS